MSKVTETGSRKSTAIFWCGSELTDCRCWPFFDERTEGRPLFNCLGAPFDLIQINVDPLEAGCDSHTFKGFDCGRSLCDSVFLLLLQSRCPC
jgi:hypothetical protein